jgi:hypothetical protein
MNTCSYCWSICNTNKLVGVAERLPEMARLLWDRYAREPFRAVELGNVPYESLP